ncbi:MAG: tetratricopeptide repeat protein [Nitrospirota bacterium]
MGLFDFLKKEEKSDRDKIFHKIHEQMTAMQIVDQAISYRNLKQYDKAISLLKEAIRKYPAYLPAKTILGTTLAHSGDIDGAELQFNKILTEHAQRQDYPLVEVYANLGSLYHNDRKDIQTALKYYQLALNAPRPKEVRIDDRTYEVMVSAVFCDLCSIYFRKQDFQLARQYALKRLQTVNDCPTASRVNGHCLFFEVFQKGVDLDKDIKDADLENIVECLQIVIKDSPMDYASIAFCATALLFMRQMKFYSRRVESIRREESEYVERLKSEKAKDGYKIYQDFASKFS